MIFLLIHKKLYIYTKKNCKLKHKILYCFIVCLVIVSCKNETTKNTINFDVNKELLFPVSQSITNNLHFNVPVNFTKINITSLENLKNVGLDSISNLPLLNHRFYFNEKDKSIIITSVVDKSYNKDLILAETLKYSKNKKLWEKESSTEYVNNELSFNQFLLQNKDYIVFKLLVEKDKRTSELNYIISKRNYTEDIAKNIESSIGSIK